MINLLALKAVIYDNELDALVSPSYRDFVWKPNDTIVRGGCTLCGKNIAKASVHTCGIHVSPNYSALTEYFNFPNSVIALMNTWGWFSVWLAPKDIPYAYVARAWGVSIVGFVNWRPTPQTQVKKMMINANKGHRESILMRTAERYKTAVVDQKDAEEMIELTWKENSQLGWSPYDKEVWNAFYYSQTNV